MITKPLFKSVPTFRDYDDYLYGEAYVKGWNEAMLYIFGEEITNVNAEEKRSCFKVVDGGSEVKYEGRAND